MSYYLANLQYGKFLSKRGYPSRAIGYLQRALNSDPTNENISALLKTANSKVKQ
jgi:predicted Zn-dependent protease